MKRKLGKPTLSKDLGILRYQPMASLDVRNLRVREEFLDSGNVVIPDVSALRASDNKSWAVVLHRARFPVREISHVIERST